MKEEKKHRPFDIPPPSPETETRAFPPIPRAEKSSTPPATPEPVTPNREMLYEVNHQCSHGAIVKIVNRCNEYLGFLQCNHEAGHAGSCDFRETPAQPSPAGAAEWPTDVNSLPTETRDVARMAQAHAQYHDKVTLSEGTLNAIENTTIAYAEHIVAPIRLERDAFRDAMQCRNTRAERELEASREEMKGLRERLEKAHSFIMDVTIALDAKNGQNAKLAAIALRSEVDTLKGIVKALVSGDFSADDLQKFKLMVGA